MKYYVIEPEVAGGFGERTLIDKSPGPMRVKSLHYQFDGWLGDELIESTPCFIVTRRLAREIEREHLTGVRFADVEVTTSDEFRELHPSLKLPEFVWLKVDGAPEKNDFGTTSDLNLIVSEQALRLLTQIGISHAASIKPFSTSPS
jgi:hypothetical protein